MWLIKLKAMLVPLLVGVLVGAGLVAGVWLWMPSCAEKNLKKSVSASHTAETGLIADRQKTRIIYRDRIKLVERRIDNSDNFECLDAVDLRLFNDASNSESDIERAVSGKAP